MAASGRRVILSPVKRALTLFPSLLAVALVFLAPALAQAQPTGEAEKLRKQAAALHADGRDDEAVDKLREALVHSNHAQIYFDLCLVLESAGKLQQARSACRAVRHGDDASDSLLRGAQKALDRIDRKINGEADPDPDPDPPPAPDPPPPDPQPDPVVPPNGNNGSPNANGSTVTQPLVQIQPPPPSPLAFGVKLGFNVANVDDSDAVSNDSRTAFAIGGSGVYAVSELFGFSIEGLLTGKGTSFDDGAIGISASVNLLYLEVPITGRITFAAGEQLKLHGFAGLAPAILLSAEIDGGGLGGEDISDTTTPVDVGLVIGGGIAYAMGSGALTGDIRVTRGLVNVVDDGNSSGDAFNQVVSFLGGYQF